MMSDPSDTTARGIWPGEVTTALPATFAARLLFIGPPRRPWQALLDLKPYFASTDAVPDAVVGWHAQRKRPEPGCSEAKSGAASPRARPRITLRSIRATLAFCAIYRPMILNTEELLQRARARYS